MPLVTAGYNAAAAGVSGVSTYASLHTGDPGTTGTNEATGGSPAYARKALTWAAAANGQVATSAAVTFDVAAGTYTHLGLWSAVTGGTFAGYWPLGGFTPSAGTIATTGTITSPAHGLANTDRVLLFDIQAGGLPTGVTEGTVYFVVASAADTFQVSATSGGAAITVTPAGKLGFVKVLPETFAGQGQYQLAASAIVVDARWA